MSTILVTGFPGFLGSELVPRILRRAPQSRVVCLVQSKFAELAARRVQEIASEQPSFAGRIELVEGDITQPGLGADGLAGAAPTSARSSTSRRSTTSRCAATSE